MNPFTYKEYIYYKKIILKEESSTLRECDEKYSYVQNNKKVDKPHDKIFKEILEDKEEVIKFLNENLKLENTENELKKDDIEKYNREFIGEDFSKTESDIIYKMKNQNIFFLIEHQSTIDYSMPYRILKYNMAIIDSAIDMTKIKNKNYKFPAVYSFVIYTGNRKWNVQEYIVKKQESLFEDTKRRFANFQVIDVNNYSKEELLKSKMLLAKVMLLEKAKNIEDLEKYIEEIIKEEMSKKQSDFLIRILNYILKDKISKEKLEKIKNKLIKKEGEKIMFVQIINDWVDEMLAKEENINKKEQKVAQKEEKVAQKEEKVAQKEEKVAQKEEKVAQKEEIIIQKEKDITAKEKNITQKEKDITAKEKNITQKEKDITAKEKNITQKQKELDQTKNRIITNMLKSNIDEQFIIEMLEIDKSEIEKIKQEIKS